MFMKRTHLTPPSRLTPLLVSGLLLAGLASPLEAGGFLSKAKPSPARPGLPSLYPTAQNLGTTLIILLLATDAPGAGVAGQPFNPSFAVPGLDLSGSSASSSQAARSVGLALTRANATAGLPALDDLNTLLATLNPIRGSILRTLPGADGTTLPLDPESAEQAASQGGADEETTKALRILTVSELTETFYTLECIGNQLVADSAIFAFGPNLNLSIALRVAGYELISAGFLFALQATQATTEGAQQAVNALLDRPKPPSSGTPAGTPPKPAPDTRLKGLVDPSIIYGTWQRLETSPSGQILVYRITPQAFVRISSALDDQGDETIEAELHPGAITGQVSYKRPAGSVSLEDALGPIKVVVLITKLDGSRMTFKFTYLKARGLDGDHETAIDVLEEQEGEQKAFYRVSVAGPD
jgi:hypothetical protein